MTMERKKAGGLGKRKMADTLDSSIDTIPNVYFPVDEDLDDIQQVSLMLAHAELSLGIILKAQKGKFC